MAGGGFRWRSPRVSRAAAEKGRKTSRLTDQQWNAVKASIHGRPRGVSILEACKQAATALQRGTFKNLNGIVVTISANALRQRFYR